MDVEAEIRDLKRRVDELEGGFDVVTQQVQGVHRDLRVFQQQTNQRFDKVDRRVDRVDGRLQRADGRLGRVETEVRHLREGLPSVVGDVMREVLREVLREQKG